MQLTYRPIVAWPGAQATSQKASPFDASYSSTMEVLDRELRMVRARQPVLELFIYERDVRVDGHLRADVRPYAPGVVLHFETRQHGALRYSCDQYRHWHHNLRAIALGLEALRKVDRYGIGTGGEQYTGYRALPPGGIALGAGMSIDDAASFVAEHAGAMWTAGDLLDAPGVVHVDSVKHAYRLASKALHPDRGGDPALFARLTEAYEVLTKGA